MKILVAAIALLITLSFLFFSGSFGRNPERHHVGQWMLHLDGELIGLLDIQEDTIESYRLTIESADTLIYRAGARTSAAYTSKHYNNGTSRIMIPGDSIWSRRQLQWKIIDANHAEMPLLVDGSRHLDCVRANTDLVKVLTQQMAEGE